MADNVAVTAGSGTTMGADEVIDGTLGTVKVPFAKIMDGTLDSTNKLTVNASGEALVKPTANSQIDVNKVAGTAVDVNSGNKSAGTQRIVIATDQPQLTNALKVDGSAVTQPVSGSITADTELTTADLDTGVGTDTRAVVGLVGSKSGGGVLIPGDATKGLAVDLTATGQNSTALKVDGSAVTQPVSGTVTVQQSTAANLKVDLSGTAANATAIKVDNSGVTQPISGTVTANIGTSGALALETGGNLATIAANTSAPTTVRYGQATVSVTNTAVQLSNQACSAVVVQALAGNVGNVVIGDSSVTTANGFQLQPGQATGIAISNVNKLYVNGTSGDGVCWLGS